MECSSNVILSIVADSDQYQLAKYQALSLPMEELMRLRDVVQSEINRRANEEAQRLREEEERRKKEEEEVDALFAAWLPHHFERSDRKGEERVERHQRGPRFGSATESDYEGGSDAGFEYPIEEVSTSDESSDAAEQFRKMKRYFDWKLRLRFDFEGAKLKIFSRTMQQGEPKDEEQPLLRIEPRVVPAGESSTSDEDLPDISRDDEEEGSSDEEEETSSEDSDTSPTSSGSSYSEWFEEDEDWSYDDEDC